MKLIFCNECHDIINMRYEERACICGKSKGHYVDEINLEYSGPCRVLGFSNKSFTSALAYRQHNGNSKGIVFKSFVIPPHAESIKRVEETEVEQTV